MSGRPGRRERIYDAVRRVPTGRVATYGQIASLAGLPGQARLVGYALAALEADSDVPWHRIVNARGAISLPPGDHSALIQRARLEAEGVAFDGDRIALERWGWQPHTAAGRPTPRSTP